MASSLGIASMEFKASDCWLSKFMKRYISLRKSTSLFKLEDSEIVKRAISFKNYIDMIDMSKYHPSNVIAMDVKAVFMGHGGSQRTVDDKGASSIYIPATG